MVVVNMDETVDEYELKTTMSPGAQRQEKRATIKAPTILATKKNIRRSMVSNKLRLSLKPSKVIEIFSSNTETSSSKSCGKDEDDIIIQATDDEEEENDKKEAVPEFTHRETPQLLSQTKIASIKQWIDNIVPHDVSDDKGTQDKPPQDNRTKKSSERESQKPINSTILTDTTFIPFDKWICKTHTAEKRTKPSQILPKDGKDTERQKTLVSTKTRLKNVENDQKTDKTRKTPPNNILHPNNSKFQTPVKQCNDLKKTTKISKENIQHGRNEDASGFITPAKQVADNYEYTVKLLDELYGTSWHKNRNKVLSEAKPSTAKPQIHKLKDLKPVAATEPRKPKKSRPEDIDVYRNPYLDSEREKSKNLLKSLQQERLATRLKSPFFAKPTFADVETSSSEDDVPRLKRTVLFPSSKKTTETQKKATSHVKKFINDSSSDSDSDNLTEKLQKITLNDKKVKQLSFLASLSKTAPLNQCDPSALIFRERYLQHREALCVKLFHLYNERIFDKCFPADMQLQWNTRLTNTAGVCVCMKKTHRDRSVTRYARLKLSTKILDSPDRLRDTLVHELCHAATFIVNGVSDGHGQMWKAWAAKAMRTFPELPPIRRCHDYAINYKYTYKCTQCAYSFGRHSKSLNLQTTACKLCLGRFEVFLNKTEKGEKKSVPCTPKKEATGFALFVKENYAMHKSPSLTHADLMKFLGRKYQERKDTEKICL